MSRPRRGPASDTYFPYFSEPLSIIGVAPSDALTAGVTGTRAPVRTHARWLGGNSTAQIVFGGIAGARAAAEEGA